MSVPLPWIVFNGELALLDLRRAQLIALVLDRRCVKEYETGVQTTTHILHSFLLDTEQSIRDDLFVKLLFTC